ncbi:MAG TPA: neuraminidase-like domain-containing protein, partial [Gemmatimonadaceae bacterium]
WIATAVADATRGWFDLNGLLVSTNSSSFGAKASFEALEHLIDYNTLRGRQPRDAAPLTDVFDLGEKKSLITTIVPALASRMGWSDEDLGSLVATMGLTPGDFQDERAVARLQAAFTLLGRSGVRAATVADWVADQILPPVTANIVRAARAYVGVEQWSGRAKQVRDRLLEGQRDALVAYFRGAGLPEVSALPSPPAPPSQRFPDEKAIFDRYHVDIEMGATFLTTRLRLALTSIQLFTERCLMNLEPFPLNDEQVRQWKSYMSRYRVWQAAIDILLRPHEYTDITLFTPENERYQTFGRSLSQREVSLASIEDGFRTYLSGLLDLSQLVIAGMYEEPDSGILHVVARTPATPPIYYYTRRDGASWSTLQRITADINAEGAVYPAMFLNLLYVIWPIITSKPDDGWNQNQDVPQAGGSVTVNDPRKHLEIQIGWTVFRDGKWSSKRLSDTISTSFGPEDSDGIAFKAMVEQVSDESGPHQELRVVCGLGTSTMEES